MGLGCFVIQTRIFPYSRKLKRIVLAELTISWETTIPNDHAITTSIYYMWDDLPSYGAMARLKMQGVRIVP